MDYETVALVIRAIAASLLTLVCLQIIDHGRPIPRLIRELIASVILFGMWALVFGGAVPVFGIDPGWARTLYTGFTVYAAIVAVGILTSRILDD